jgi:polyferredoxin
LAWLLLGLIAWHVGPPAEAEELYRDEIESFIGTDYLLGERLDDLPVYPVFAAPTGSPAPKPELLGYAFESVDFLEVRGFSGKPMNALVLLDLSGHIRHAQLVSHKEPLFLRAGKKKQLEQFTQQIEGLSLRHRVELGYASDPPERSADYAKLQGVLNGTVSIQAISRAVFESAATVALAKLQVDPIEQDIKKRRDPSDESWRVAVDLDANPPSTEVVAPALQLNTWAQSGDSMWQGIWRKRWLDLSILGVALALLSVLLLRARHLSASHRRLRWVRSGYALFTLFFIGWHAQGQLTIVNLTAALEAWRGGSDLAFMLNDPITVVLWAYVGLSLLVWGRGTFCGWLCPFGALQEWVSIIALRLGLRARRLRQGLDLRLKWLKYVILVAVLATAWWSPEWHELVVEVEPFKTAISTQFGRSWPYVVWALAMLALSAVVYRGYCRYICPLGAALAALSVLRRWNWIARRSECGTPCQSCRHRCGYQSIAANGAVQYSECFQCLDCVAIYQDPQACLPLIRMDKLKRREATS